GSPDLLALQEIEKPTPKEHQLLIKVHAAAANPLDWHKMRGTPFLVRLSDGFLKPKDTRIGADIAGQVEAVGSNVTQFRPGDEVFGVGAGGFAEYACAGETKVALKPANLSFEAAAAVPVAALTALQGLRDKGQIQPGQKVLINGAAGGVGTFAVQMAKAFGAEVTGVCSTRNVELVRSIGADHVIDYTQTDFTRNGQPYDLIFDAVGNRSVADYQRALRANGICTVAGFTTLARLCQVVVLGAWVSKTSNKKIGLMGIAQPNSKDLIFIKELLETGKIVPVIDRRYPLAETADAIRYLEAGHARGKVIITVA
ncbi:MAG: NAD(P)-dependent alcohol dehydrogenase, partial [Chloroflexi bacterium]|nr:NAD(P)-dependent alcohol dehydrogenase [Chloroflexota bacterium]